MTVNVWTCDHCKTVTPSDPEMEPLAVVPTGWFVVRQVNRDGASSTFDHEFCSLACLTRFYGQLDRDVYHVSGTIETTRT